MEVSLLFILSATALLVLLIANWAIRYTRTVRLMRPIPGPNSTSWIYGDLAKIQGNREIQYMEMSKKLGSSPSHLI